MGFATGLATGLATSIDRELRKGMDRAEKIIDQSAEYHLKRKEESRQAQLAERKEIKESIALLGGLVGGDVDKAAQLYRAAGGSKAGAEDLYKKLAANRDAGVDIGSLVSFAERKGDPKDLENYISTFATSKPYQGTPATVGATNTGLYGALFEPDLTKKVEDRVAGFTPDEAAPAAVTDLTAARIDLTKGIGAEDRAEVLKERERAAGRFDLETKRYDLDVDRLELSQDQFSFQKDEAAKAADRALKADAREEDRLNLAKQTQQFNERMALRNADRSDLAIRIDAANLKMREQQFEQDFEKGKIELDLLRTKLAKENKPVTYESLEKFRDSLKEREIEARGAGKIEEADALQEKVNNAQAAIVAYASEVAQAEDTDTGPDGLKLSSISPSTYLNSTMKANEKLSKYITQDIDGTISYKLEGANPLEVARGLQEVADEMRMSAERMFPNDEVKRNAFLAAVIPHQNQANAILDSYAINLKDLKAFYDSPEEVLKAFKIGAISMPTTMEFKFGDEIYPIETKNKAPRE